MCSDSLQKNDPDYLNQSGQEYELFIANEDEYNLPKKLEEPIYLYALDRSLNMFKIKWTNLTFPQQSEVVWKCNLRHVQGLEAAIERMKDFEDVILSERMLIVRNIGFNLEGTLRWPIQVHLDDKLGPL